LACLVLLGRVAVAETVEPSRVVYSAEGVEGCPTPREFEASVHERIRGGRLANEHEPAREYRVDMRAVGSRFVARLDFTEANGAKRTREVASDACADAASAIALVTALAIDAAGSGQRTDEDGAAEGTLTPSEALGLVPPPSAAPQAPPPSANPPPDVGTKPATASPAPSDAPRPARRAVPLHFDAGIRGTVTTSKASEVLPGVELSASLAADGAIPWLVELGFAGERNGKELNGPGSTRFSFLGARARGCAFAWQPMARLDVRPCVVIETGAVVAEGFIANPATQVDGWFALGGAGRVMLRIGPLAIAAEVGPLFPVTRDHYIFGRVTNPEAVHVHDVSPAGVYASLGVALQIF
jgi:hypothetical protein